MVLRKVFSIHATILMPLAVVTLFVCPIIVQIGTPDGVYAHIDALAEGAFVFFLSSFALMFQGHVMSIASVASLLMIIAIIVLWFIFSIKKKHKSIAAIIFGIINMLVAYFFLLVFVFNTNDLVYKGVTELENPGLPFFLALQPFSTVFHPIFGYGLLGAFVLASLCFVFTLVAFIGDVASRSLAVSAKKKEPASAPAPATQEEPKVEPSPAVEEAKPSDDERLRQLIREELARHNGQVSEDELVAAVSAPKVEEKPSEEVKPEEKPAPELGEEPKYNTLDPIEKIFSDIESNRPELENPLPKKGEESAKEVKEEKKVEEKKPEEMSIEEKMEQGIKDPNVVKVEEKEEEDEIERLEDEHLD